MLLHKSQGVVWKAPSHKPILQKYPTCPSRQRGIENTVKSYGFLIISVIIYSIMARGTNKSIFEVRDGINCFKPRISVFKTLLVSYGSFVAQSDKIAFAQSQFCLSCRK